MEDDGLTNDENEEDDDDDEDEDAPPTPKLLEPEPDTSAVETAFAAMQLKPRMEIADDAATKARNQWDDDSEDAASSEDEPETEDDELEGEGTKSEGEGLTDAKPGMGVGEGAAEYDPDVLFHKVVAYFDLSELAQRNGLEMPKGNVEEGDKK